MPCLQKSMSGAAMPWLPPPPRSHTHGLLMPKTGCSDGILSFHMIWDHFIVQGLTKYNHCCPNSCSSPALNHSTLRVIAILHLVMSTALKRPCLPKLHTKNYQELETTQEVHKCKYNHICIFGCIGHVLEVKKMYYGCIGKVSFRITS